jgi:hypothetical protein
LGPIISLDISDVDVLNSDWVITWSYEFIECYDDRVRSIIMKSNEMILSRGPVNHGPVNHNELELEGG